MLQNSERPPPYHAGSDPPLEQLGRRLYANSTLEDQTRQTSGEGAPSDAAAVLDDLRLDYIAEVLDFAADYPASAREAAHRAPPNFSNFIPIRLSGRMSVDPTEAERGRIKSVWPNEFDDGVRCGLLRKFEGEREQGGYPKGFHHWPLERRNSWYAGFNIGHCKRMEAGR